jgi:3-isopropylmalate dehydrogenase
MLVDASPLKREVVEGTDIMVIRELTGGLYFGEPRGGKSSPTAGAGHQHHGLYLAGDRAVARTAFEVAMKRKKRLASVTRPTCSSSRSSGVKW